jgi:hypothetical protein
MQVESQQLNMTLSRASAGRPVGPSKVADWFIFHSVYRSLIAFLISIDQ